MTAYFGTLSATDPTVFVESHRQAGHNAYLDDDWSGFCETCMTLNATTPQGWVDYHKQGGHDAVLTSVAAPGWGTGSYCYTCTTYGPCTGGMLTLEDVR